MYLFIESSTKVCSAALLHTDGRITLKEEEGEGFVHSEKLARFMEQLLLEIPAKESLKGVAISQGPGSYTGLRIGTSLAKGLCYAKGVPLFSYCPLEAMSSQIDKGVRFAFIDARRNEVFGRLADAESELKATWSEDFDQPEMDWNPWKGQDVFLLGDCQDKVKQALESLGVVGQTTEIQASALWAAKAFQNNSSFLKEQDVAYFVPLYGKDFQITAPKN